MNSVRCILYLDDVIIGGNLDYITSDLEVIREAESLGLFLNNNKSEIITASNSILSSLLHHLSGAHLIVPSQVTLLCPPLGDESPLSTALSWIKLILFKEWAATFVVFHHMTLYFSFVLHLQSQSYYTFCTLPPVFLRLPCWCTIQF